MELISNNSDLTLTGTSFMANHFLHSTRASVCLEWEMPYKFLNSELAITGESSNNCNLQVALFSIALRLI